jgi:hypothetical protein
MPCQKTFSFVSLGFVHSICLPKHNAALNGANKVSVRGHVFCEDFMALLLQHVLPKGLRRARDYGFLHGNAKRLLKIVQWVLRVPLPVKEEKGKSALPLPTLQRLHARDSHDTAALAPQAWVIVDHKKGNTPLTSKRRPHHPYDSAFSKRCKARSAPASIKSGHTSRPERSQSKIDLIPYKDTSVNSPGSFNNQICRGKRDISLFVIRHLLATCFRFQQRAVNEYCHAERWFPSLLYPTRRDRRSVPDYRTGPTATFFRQT